MNEILKVETSTDRITVSARDLHAFVESQERFSKWFERMEGYGFEINIDYTPYQKVHPQNYQIIEDYQLTIEMGKEISMIQRSEKGRQARKYFIELEKAWNTPERIMQRALEISKVVIEEQRLQIGAMKPKALFADAVSASHTSILIGDLAKLIKQNGVDIGQNKLFEWLRENEFLIKRKSTSFNMPTQKSMELGLFEIKERTVSNPDGSVKITKTTKVTGKGQIYFINKFIGGN